MNGYPADYVRRPGWTSTAAAYPEAGAHEDSSSTAAHDGCGADFETTTGTADRSSDGSASIDTGAARPYGLVKVTALRLKSAPAKAPAPLGETRTHYYARRPDWKATMASLMDEEAGTDDLASRVAR